jgi:hypothetical protein
MSGLLRKSTIEAASCVAAKWYSCPPLVHAMVVWLRPCAASQGMETDPVFNSDEQLLAVLAMLEECRSALAASGNRDSAHLVSVAALDVRMKLNRIGDAELRLLCEAMVAKEEAGNGSHEARPLHEAKSLQEATSSQTPPRRPLLRVVK